MLMSTEQAREGSDGETDLFGQSAAASAPQPEQPAARPGKVRVVMPNRHQIELRPMDLESLLPVGHRARLVWAWVERQDLSAMYEAIKVREGGVGRSAIAPEILLTLWLYATLEGVGSARQLSRLVMEHDAYRWISGGVQVNHHLLSDFRVGHGATLDELLSASLAAMADAGVVKLERVAQDGVRVRADAGAASFRRKASLQDKLDQARQRVAELKTQLQSDPGQDNRRKTAARQRAEREMQDRLQRALDRMPELEAIKRRNGGKAEDARASSTDADATVMKMADGGFRPAFNAQLASDCDTQVIVGVEVATSGSDMGQMAPMVEQVEQRLGRCPQQWLVDGGFPAHEQIDAVAGKTEVLAPVPVPRQR
jgi:transposase